MLNILNNIIFLILIEHICSLNDGTTYSATAGGFYKYICSIKHVIAQDLLFELPNFASAMMVTWFFCISKKVTQSSYYIICTFTWCSGCYIFHGLLLFFKNEFTSNSKKNFKLRIRNFALKWSILFIVVIAFNAHFDHCFSTCKAPGKYRSAINLVIAGFALILTFKYAIKAHNIKSIPRQLQQYRRQKREEIQEDVSMADPFKLYVKTGEDKYAHIDSDKYEEIIASLLLNMEVDDLFNLIFDFLKRNTNYFYTMDIIVKRKKLLEVYDKYAKYTEKPEEEKQPSESLISASKFTLPLPSTLQHLPSQSTVSPLSKGPSAALRQPTVAPTINRLPSSSKLKPFPTSTERTSSTVSSLAKCNDIFTTRSYTVIPVVLKSFTDAMIFAHTRLTTLDLSDNAIGSQDIPGLSQFLSTETCFGLKYLYLNNCGLGNAGLTIAKSLIRCHQRAIRAGKYFDLQVFAAGKNCLKDSGAKALAEAFSTLKSLVEVRMYQNGIRDDGIEELAKAFAENPKLKIVDLHDNTFNEQSATIMSKVLGKLNNLVCVDFTDCNCGSKGCLNIVREFIVSDSYVEELKLGGNRIGLITIKKIAQSSIVFPSLKKLVLSSNNLGSSFKIVKKEFENMVVDFGKEDDDKGSIDESEADDEEKEV